jgi:hypothetical protein
LCRPIDSCRPLIQLPRPPTLPRRPQRRGDGSHQRRLRRDNRVFPGALDMTAGRAAPV